LFEPEGTMLSTVFSSRALIAALLLSGAAHAQQPSAAPEASAAPEPPAASANGPAPLAVHFALGSATIRHQDEAVLDNVSRAYNEGHPIIMTLSGASDTVGPAEPNLVLSQQRAIAVLRSLVARGIPADRFQLVAKGETEPVVKTPAGVAEERNRRVEITWR